MNLPDGFRIGHWSDLRALTGCTVILCPAHTVGGCDVRGSSPGSRELALLASDKTMQEVHAVLLTGGSAFGLGAADGVMSYLEEKGVGYKTPWGRVPIVPAAVIFDLNVGDGSVRPTAEAGYRACQYASGDGGGQGSLGAGTGATVGKWAGFETRMKGGLGIASLEERGLLVCAVAVVNAVGDVVDSSGKTIAGARTRDGRWLADDNPLRLPDRSRMAQLSNTTLVAIMTNAKLSKVEVNRLAQRGHDGMARAIRPAHTSYDGDVTFGLAMGAVEAGFDIVAELGAEVTAEAIRNGVRPAQHAADAPAPTAPGPE